jgi:23S rRNA pseudouridine1911/1915/1917 synthase
VFSINERDSERESLSPVTASVGRMLRWYHGQRRHQLTPLRLWARRHGAGVVKPLRCPCCGGEVRSTAVRHHLAKCAPDAEAYVLSRVCTWPVEPSLALALAQEGQLACLKRLKHLRFGERLGWAVISERCQLPEDRLKRILRQASKAIDLVLDTEPLEVIYEDSNLLVVAKPAHLRMCPIHRFQGGSLLNRVAGYVGADSAIPRVVHRLDENTSGVCLFAKSKAAASFYTEAFRLRSVGKEYLALCVGLPPAVQFWVDAPIARHPTLSVARTLSSSPDGQAARTHVRVEAFRAGSGARPPVCLVRAKPLTGRTHQVRLHLAASGLPIVLDSLYGPRAETLSSILHTGMRRQALHAAALGLPPFGDNQALRFEAALPGDMRLLGESMGLFSLANDCGNVPPLSSGVLEGEAAVATLGDGSAPEGGALPSIQGMLCLDWAHGNLRPVVGPGGPCPHVQAGAARD